MYRFLSDKRLLGRQLSAASLAKAAGLYLLGAESALGLDGSTLRYDARAPDQWRDAAITREVARWALRRYGADESAAAVSAATRALLNRPQSGAELRDLVNDVG